MLGVETDFTVEKSPSCSDSLVNNQIIRSPDYKITMRTDNTYALKDPI
jgi:hypothetical protein